MFWDNLRCIIEGLNKSFERKFHEFDEYSNVEGLCELKELIVSLRDTDILVGFDRVAHYVVDDSNFKTEVYGGHSKISNEFLKMSNKELSSLLFGFIHIEYIQGFVTFNDIEGFLMLIQFNYFYYSKMGCSRFKVMEMGCGGDIIQYLSFFTDEYKLFPDLPDYDESFFNNLKNMTYGDERARLLEDFLRCGYLSLILVEQNLSGSFFNHIKASAQYLMACNALKRGSLKISCEDVVIGYTLTLKCIVEDMRPYVRSAFYRKK
ncbi:MAG: hypothetical protein J6P12_02045 [Methanobrevibacter sp.]|nr:hypothetical protein [Methanobrevibacter sp.]